MIGDLLVHQLQRPFVQLLSRQLDVKHLDLADGLPLGDVHGLGRELVAPCDEPYLLHEQALHF